MGFNALISPFKEESNCTTKTDYRSSLPTVPQSHCQTHLRELLCSVRLPRQPVISESSPTLRILNSVPWEGTNPCSLGNRCQIPADNALFVGNNGNLLQRGKQSRVSRSHLLHTTGQCLKSAGEWLKGADSGPHSDRESSTVRSHSGVWFSPAADTAGLKEASRTSGITQLHWSHVLLSLALIK